MESLGATLDATRNGPSWEQRQELGFLQAIFLTIRDVLFKPSDTFGNMKYEM